MTKLSPRELFESSPDAVCVTKRPIAVSAIFADGPGVCQTLEGRVGFDANDALIKGVRDEYWPVQRYKFDMTYRSVGDTVKGLDGMYVKRRLEVKALKLKENIEVQVGWQEDPIVGRPGDWLLRYGPNDFGVVASEIFTESYEIVAS